MAGFASGILCNCVLSDAITVGAFRLSNTLEGQTAVVFGVANKRSIAWAIAQKLQSEGARLAITYQNERLRQEAEDMIHALPNAEGFQCDVSSDAEIEQLFATLKEKYGKLDHVIHSVAYAPAEDLKGRFKDTSREGFRVAHDVSCYSLIAISRAAQPLMTDGGSIVTLTYYGSTRVVPYYNIMGVAKAALECTVRYLAYDLGGNNIRVNAISAGPIKTLAARGIGSFGEILKEVNEKAPLKRNIDQHEVADTAAFLCSQGARGITGETVYVDAGINIMAF